MRHSGRRQARCGRELVVRGHQGGSGVEDVDALALQHAQLPEAALDAVEGLSNVEAAKRGVPRAELAERLLGSEDGCIDPETVARPDEASRGRAVPPRDDPEPPRAGVHETTVAEPCEPVGCRLVSVWRTAG
jgi:hypothetical protein